MNRFSDVKLKVGITGDGLFTSANSMLKQQLGSGTASTAVRLPLANSSVSGSSEFGCWVVMSMPVPWSIIWGDSSVPAPIQTSHTGSASRDQTCFDVGADQPYQRWVPVDTYYRVIQSSGGLSYLSIEMTSGTEVGD